MKLAENVKAARRELGMTQEQLAETMGVTVGAVSKWESGTTVPDITLLLSMAELFQTSLDALMGFVLQNGGAEEQVESIKECIAARSYDKGRARVEKALCSFPNHFGVVYQSALFYELLGLERRENEALHRAIALHTRAEGLLNQNGDRSISRRTIQVGISGCYTCLGEHRKALEILQRGNDGGINDDLVGAALMRLERYDEALQVLSESFVDSTARIFRAVTGMVNCLGGKAGDHAAALELEEWLVSFQESLCPERACYLHKSNAALLTCCAAIAGQMGEEEKSLAYLRRARDAAELFDADPSYEMQRMRFYRGRSATAHDDLGETAEAGILRNIGYQSEENQKLLNSLWEKVRAEK